MVWVSMVFGSLSFRMFNFYVLLSVQVFTYCGSLRKYGLHLHFGMGLLLRLAELYILENTTSPNTCYILVPADKAD